MDRFKPNQIIDHWVLIKRLGVGSTLDVWLARDKDQSSLQVALKLLNTEHLAIMEHFYAEAEFLSHLSGASYLLPAIEVHANKTSNKLK